MESYLHSIGPILLGLSPQIKGGDDDGAEDVAAEGRDWRSLDPHRDEDQVQLDVNRSFIYYPQGMYGILYPSHYLFVIVCTLTATVRRTD